MSKSFFIRNAVMDKKKHDLIELFFLFYSLTGGGVNTELVREVIPQRIKRIRASQNTSIGPGNTSHYNRPYFFALSFTIHTW